MARVLAHMQRVVALRGEKAALRNRALKRLVWAPLIELPVTATGRLFGRANKLTHRTSIMGIVKALLLAVLLNLSATAVAVAGGTEKEADAMLDRALAYIKSHGNEDAFKAFSDPDNKEFH